MNKVVEMNGKVYEVFMASNGALFFYVRLNCSQRRALYTSKIQAKIMQAIIEQDHSEAIEMNIPIIDNEKLDAVINLVTYLDDHVLIANEKAANVLKAFNITIFHSWDYISPFGSDNNKYHCIAYNGEKINGDFYTFESDLDREKFIAANITTPMMKNENECNIVVLELLAYMNEKILTGSDEYNTTCELFIVEAWNDENHAITSEEIKSDNGVYMLKQTLYIGNSETIIQTVFTVSSKQDAKAFSDIEEANIFFDKLIELKGNINNITQVLTYAPWYCKPTDYALCAITNNLIYTSILDYLNIYKDTAWNKGKERALIEIVDRCRNGMGDLLNNQSQYNDHDFKILLDNKKAVIRFFTRIQQGL